MAPTQLDINGARHTLEVAANRSLLFVLRDELRLTGCKYGCGEGQCGACTVLLDGEAARSCLTAVGECAGKKIETIEGLAEGDRLHPLQEAFLACDALQCGYCTPGMIMSGIGLLRANWSTPNMAPQLSRAAAAAREILLDLAAERGGIERGSLVIRDGKVTHAASGKSFTFGEITQGQKLAKTIAADVSITSADRWQVAGKSAAKVDGRAMVTGKHHFSPDIRLPGMLLGKVLRPPALGATLASVDLTLAQAMEHVAVVRDGEFVGVAAPNEHLASRALAAIHAEWNTPAGASDRGLYQRLKQAEGRGRGDRRPEIIEKALAD
jgi:aerobic-type carbon monoxide dehydrogenase small subunit (CoxS/CutS family)